MTFTDLQKLCEDKLDIIKLADIARELNVTPQVVSNWKARNQVPYKYVKKLKNAIEKEKNANNTLILKGAKIVDEEGQVIDNEVLSDFEDKLKAILDTPQTAEVLIEKFDHSINIDYLRKLISILPSIKKILDGDLEKYIIKPNPKSQTNLF